MSPMQNQIHVDTWKAKMSVVGCDGLTGFQRRGIAIKQARIKNGTYKDQGQKILAALGKEGIEKRRQKALATFSEKHDAEHLLEMRRYRNRVNYLSRKNDLTSLENFHLWNKGYELDHMVSTADGFMNGLQPEIISHISNLRFIPAKQNRQKNKKSSISIQQLLEQIK